MRRYSANLAVAMSLVGLRTALHAENQTSVKQRLGYVLSVLGLDRMAEEVHRSLPKRLAVALLQTQARVAASASDAHPPWMVLDNVGLETERP
jgi:hypothetical protein